MLELQQVRFKGQRDDIGANYTSPEYLRTIQNGTFDDIDGVNKSLFPEVVDVTGYTDLTAGTDAGYEYRYLDSNNVLQLKQVVVQGGCLWVDVLSNPTVVCSGLTVNAKARFGVLNDKLIIVNGKDIPLIYWGDKGVAYQMGAPAATVSNISGVPNGQYYYAQSYVTSGGEEFIGSISNTVTTSGFQVNLDLTIGYSGTVSRKIYRTTAGGTTLKFLASVANNTDLAYVDNIADSALGANIGTTNNGIPKIKFIEINYNKIVGMGDPKYPTQIFVPDTAIEIIDAASFVDVSNVGNDNSPCVGMNQQFSQVVVATSKNWYLVDCSGTTTTVQPTSCNIGVLDGYSVVNIPANEKFPGGVMFMSTLKDVRVLNGLTGLVISTINNIETQNWAQVIKGSLDNEVSNNINIDAFFYNYTYHLIIGEKIWLFNTKTSSWSSMTLRNNNGVLTTPSTLFQYDGDLYIGKVQEPGIERMYKSINYLGVDCTSIVKTASIPTFQQDNGGFAYTTDIKYFDEIQVYFLPSTNYPLEYTITIDDNPNNVISGQFMCPGGGYNSNYYSSDFYDTSSGGEDYRVIRIQRFGMYLSLEIKSAEGIGHFRGYRLTYTVENAVG